MEFTPLPSVKNRILLGRPLPFNIRNADGTLLLAKGQVLQTEAQMEALFDRGALVDAVEVAALAHYVDPCDEVKKASPAELPALWEKNTHHVGMILKASSQTEFAIALAEAAQPVMALIERDPDLAIFQVVKQGTTGKSQGISRAVHSAIASTLAARRLNWSPIDAQRSFKAALTMNISVLDLQAKLANQTTPLTPAQREAIQAHPHESVKMLEASGVTDRDWLVGVEQHHEEPDGSGYPKKLIDITDIATLLRSADIYTAKLAGRAGRSAMMADAAARNFFTARTQHPVTAALIKEFGLYPPGSYVRLVTGEFGIVIKRGEQVTTPIVAALTNRSGDSLHEPMRRNCADKTYAIAAVVPESALRVRVSSEKLVVLASQ